MKRTILMFILIISVVLSSCSNAKKTENSGVESNNSVTETHDQFIYKNLDTAFDINELKESLQKNDIEKFSENFNVKLYKSTDFSTYTVINTTDGLYLVNFYDQQNDNSSIATKITFSPMENMDKVFDLKEGCSIEDAIAADPDPIKNAPWYYSSLVGVTRYSDHFFENGYWIRIEYSFNNDYVITKISTYTL